MQSKERVRESDRELPERVADDAGRQETSYLLFVGIGEDQPCGVGADVGLGWFPHEYNRDFCLAVLAQSPLTFHAVEPIRLQEPVVVAIVIAKDDVLVQTTGRATDKHLGVLFGLGESRLPMMGCVHAYADHAVVVIAIIDVVPDSVAGGRDI